MAKNGLTWDETIVACHNIGVNLECGGCASIFFTGFGGDPHDDCCSLFVNHARRIEEVEDVKDETGL